MAVRKSAASVLMEVWPPDVDQIRRVGDRPVGGVPVQAGAPDRVELGQRQIDVGADAGRVEGQDADRIGEAHALAGELQLLVGVGFHGSGGEGRVADGALLQRDGDGLGQRDVANLAVRVADGRGGADERNERLAADAGVAGQVRRHRRDGDVIQVFLGEEALLLATGRHRKGRSQPDAHYLPAHSLTPLERSAHPLPPPAPPSGGEGRGRGRPACDGCPQRRSGLRRRVRSTDSPNLQSEMLGSISAAPVRE